MIINKSNLAGIFTSFSTIFNKALEVTTTLWGDLATEVPSTSAKNDYKWLGNFPMLREWIGERHVKSLAAHQYEVANKSYEATVAVDRDDIEDDQIGVYRPMIEGLAANAKQHPDKLLFDLLKNGFATQCYDGQYYFDSDHPVGDGTVSNTGGGSGDPWVLLDTSKSIKPFLTQIRRKPDFVSRDDPDDDNVFMQKQYLYGVDYRGNVGFTLWQLAYGSKATLDAAAYTVARKAMMSFKNDEGVPLNITPNLLVVGPGNEKAAREILEKERDANGADNIWYNTAKVLVVPWLA